MKRPAGDAGSSDESGAERAYDVVLRLLARRSHFAAELDRKLRQRGFDDTDRAAALDRARGDRYLDDLRVAGEYIATRLRRRPCGGLLLRSELMKRGVDAAIVDEALAEAALDEEQLIRRAARRWMRRGRAEREALRRHLARLGFSTRDILSLDAELDRGELGP